jgi:hypothetical protein
LYVGLQYDFRYSGVEVVAMGDASVEAQPQKLVDSHPEASQPEEVMQFEDPQESKPQQLDAVEADAVEAEAVEADAGSSAIPAAAIVVAGERANGSDDDACETETETVAALG